MPNHIARFEDRVQQFLEGGLARLLAAYLHPREVLIRLATAMEDFSVQRADGHRIAPDMYIVRLNPRDHSAITTELPDLEPVFASEMISMARLASLDFISYPTIKLVADPNITMHDVAIFPHHSIQHDDTTQRMAPGQTVPTTLTSKAPAALILNEAHILLLRPLITLGRHRDNDIIIDDPGVSRHHAQLRLHEGCYVIFDLGSSSGTSVNGKPVAEKVLCSGDVIHMAKTTLIYVEEEDTHGPR